MWTKNEESDCGELGLIQAGGQGCLPAGGVSTTLVQPSILHTEKFSGFL